MNVPEMGRGGLRLAVAVLLAWGGGCPLPATGAGAGELRKERTNAQAFPRISIDVAPLDSNNRTVTSLKAADFAVTEGGQPVRDLRVAALADLPAGDVPPLELALVFDNSDSMDLNRVRDAMKRLLVEFRERDKAAIIIFTRRPASVPTTLGTATKAPRARVSQDLTSDKGLLWEAAADIKGVKGTPLWDTVAVAAAMIGPWKEDVRRAVVIITDGEDNASKWTQSEVTDALRQARVPVFVIGLIPRNVFPSAIFWPRRLDDRSLRALVTDTAGIYFPARRDTNIAGLYADIVKNLNASYRLSFESPSLSAEVLERKCDITVGQPPDQFKLEVTLKLDVDKVVDTAAALLLPALRAQAKEAEDLAGRAREAARTAEEAYKKAVTDDQKGLFLEALAGYKSIQATLPVVAKLRKDVAAITPGQGVKDPVVFASAQRHKEVAQLIANIQAARKDTEAAEKTVQDLCDKIHPQTKEVHNGPEIAAIAGGLAKDPRNAELLTRLHRVEEYLKGRGKAALTDEWGRLIFARYVEFATKELGLLRKGDQFPDARKFLRGVAEVLKEFWDTNEFKTLATAFCEDQATHVEALLRMAAHEKVLEAGKDVLAIAAMLAPAKVPGPVPVARVNAAIGASLCVIPPTDPAQAEQLSAQAAASLELAVPHLPERSAELQMLLARLYEKQRLTDKAIAAYEEVLKTDAANADATEMLGQLLFAKAMAMPSGSPQQKPLRRAALLAAVTLLDRVAAERPANHAAVARGRYELGEFHLAVPASRHAVDFSASDAGVQLYLALALYRNPDPRDPLTKERLEEIVALCGKALGQRARLGPAERFQALRCRGLAECRLGHWDAGIKGCLAANEEDRMGMARQVPLLELVPKEDGR